MLKCFLEKRMGNKSQAQAQSAENDQKRVWNRQQVQIGIVVACGLSASAQKRTYKSPGGDMQDGHMTTK